MEKSRSHLGNKIFRKLLFAYHFHTQKGVFSVYTSLPALDYCSLTLAYLGNIFRLSAPCFPAHIPTVVEGPVCEDLWSEDGHRFICYLPFKE